MNVASTSDAGISMLDSKKKLISQALFVIGYERDLTIRTKQFEIEKAMAPLVVTQTANTNLPDDFDPQAPRITLKKDRISVIFSQIAAQLTINIDNKNGVSLELIRESLIKQINLFQSCVDKIIPRNNQRELGIVLIVNYPVDSTKFSDSVVSEYIQNRFLRVTPLGTPASVGFNIGYKTEDNLFFTLSISQYKLFEGKILAKSVPQWLDLSKLPVAMSGVELKIDVNSRPLLNLPNKPADVTGTIMKKSLDFLFDDSDKFIGSV